MIYVILVLATVVAYEPVRRSDFVGIDDEAFVTRNSHVKAGINRESLIWASTTSFTGNWYPLTWLSHMLDCQLFGTAPGWHHLSSLLLHIVNSLLLLWLLKQMTGAIWPSAFVAAAFALHPLHVESVAWISERKDVLSTLLWLLTIAAYLSYTRSLGLIRYLLSLLAFALGLMAKPMLVTLPFVLLLLDYWPLGRFQPPESGKKANRLNQKSVPARSKSFPIYRLVWEKIPFFVLSAISTVVTFLAQQTAGAMEAAQSWPIGLRIANAFVSYVKYMTKMIWPRRLAVFYPYPESGFSLWLPVVCFIILAGISAFAVIYRSRQRYLVTGWFWYLGTLLPVIGLVQVGLQAMADRYTYVPSIGFFIVLAWGAREFAARWRFGKTVLPILAGLVLTALLIGTRSHVRHWQNSLTLFGHAIEVTENNARMYCSYGDALYENGQPDEAVTYLKKALQINPKYATAYFSLGSAYSQLGRIGEAIHCWNEVLELEPEHLPAVNNLAWTKATQEDPNFREPDEALRLALRICELTNYEQPEALDTLAAAYAAKAMFPQAIETAEKAARLAMSTDKEQLARIIQSRLQLYKAGLPYRRK